MDQVDPLRRCRTAEERLKEIASRLKTQGNFLVMVGKALCADEIGLRLANSDLSVPIDVPDDCTVNYNDWPSSESVKNDLSEYYEARSEFMAALRALPPEEQALFTGRTPGATHSRSRTYPVARV